MFKDNWSMKLKAWNLSDGADIERGQPEKNDKASKDAIPSIGLAPTLSFSDDGDSHAGSTGSGSKLSTQDKVVRWYNNRGRVQKVTMVIGVILLCLILISVAIWAAIGSDDAPTYSSSISEAISDPTSSPTLSPFTATDNIMDTARPIDDTTQSPVDINRDSTQPPIADVTQVPVATQQPVENDSNSAQSPTDTSQEPSTTYAPGHLKTSKFGLILSEGLDARIIAVADEKVEYEKKKRGKSKEKFHRLPSAGATFELQDGGWIYVSNSEASHKEGGVGALTFDKKGEVQSYDMLLKGTNQNKGGGKTPFGTWITCEEHGKHGHIYQVDPTGERKPEETTIGREGGSWDSFAYDIRDEDSPHFFVTEDAEDGALQRFTPEKIDWSTPWKMLHNEGTKEYLMLIPNAANDGGQFVWTANRNEARKNAELHYPYTEGLDVFESKMYFVCKKMKQLFVLDLDTGIYSRHTTEVGLFDGSPDEVERAEDASNELLYFTEDSGSDMKAGVHARDHEGKFYTVLESEIFDDETTGLSFSPDGRFMYIAYQSSGLLYAVWRNDGHPFHHEHSNVSYHD
ncbi:unnamed protein product [Cylindrotheca closterium]|uniref:Uncharacterized protein n=1 Tax=Cylindrotheca closterium TaxID=2856 RepID=A0AAD2CS19_9STRA|nr:unnamed protein product [Cylindrotheca closterium]